MIIRGALKERYMKKLLMAATAASLLLATGVAAQETTAETKTGEVDGFYAGLGGGVSFNGVSLSKGDYVEDGTNTYDVTNLSDTSGGYTIYAGYQFNKIIAVEAAFVDYGSFSDTLKIKSTNLEKTYKSSPMGGSVYANAGYTFGNGLRPFGQLGIGYLSTDPSIKINDFDDSFMTVHYGLGVEYAPASFKGFGLRAAISGDITMDGNVVATDDDGKVDESALLVRMYELLYVGVQYKF